MGGIVERRRGMKSPRKAADGRRVAGGKGLERFGRCG